MNWFIAVWNNYWPLWDYTAHVKHEVFAEWATQMNCWIFWLYLEGKGSEDWWSNFTAVFGKAKVMQTGLSHAKSCVFFQSTICYCSTVEIYFGHILTLKNIIILWFSFYAVCSWTHQMACFAWADSASCLHYNSAWGVQRSKDVIEGLASCSPCTALFHPHVLIYISRLLFSPLANHPPPSN